MLLWIQPQRPFSPPPQEILARALSDSGAIIWRLVEVEGKKTVEAHKNLKTLGALT